jgi:uncharacterized protein YndB with AHSA1/START domain
VYREIVEPKELVFISSAFEDKEGNPQIEVLNTVMFAEHNGKTKLTLTHVGLPSGEDYDNCRAGWNESFDKLAEVLAKA